MKASGIPDDVFLAAAEAAQRANAARWGRSGADAWAFTWDMDLAFPDVPYKVLRAKAAKLIKRRLMDGCPCGCRGDYEVKGTLA